MNLDKMVYKNGTKKLVYSKEFIDTLVEEYVGGVNLISLSEKYNVSSSRIFRLLKKRGVQFRRKGVDAYEVDETFFDVIDTEQKAYWLGFIVTDGCITKGNVLTIHLAGIDKEHLEKFKQDIKYVGPVRRGNNGSVYVAIWNKKLYDALIRLGLQERKSEWAKKPEGIPIELERHFWRGCIDGDGCLTEPTFISKGNRYSYPSINLVGTESLVESFRQYCLGLYLVKGKTKKLKSQRFLYSFHCSCIGALKIMSTLYDKNLVSLARKMERYNHYIEKYKLSTTSRVK